ncbi:MAG: TonB-dependent receptor plug domain-containing protein, partial [Chitinophagaceae bacterium]
MRKILILLLSSILLCTELWAQTRVITGKVSDANGNPIPNASVVIKGSNSGTTTNNEGVYSLSVPANARTLVISSIGLTEQELRIGTNTTLNSVLQSTDQSLQEVVVTSFGIRRDRKTLGYSAPVIKADELTAVKNTNVSNALVGKVAGVRVQGSGGSFTGSNVLIRGYTSVTGSNQPLYVVDGIPIDNSGGGTALQTGPTTTNRAVDINPEDIENMTVLKGAAATSLYGSRAAGGAILITTKKGRTRAKNAIEISSSYNVVQANRLPDYQNMYAQGVGGNYNNRSSTSWGPEIKGQTVTNFFNQPEQLQAYPDNVKDITENGYNLQNNISFSGGSDKTSYRVSYGNTNETFIIKNNMLRRNNLTVNLSSNVTSKLTVGTFINFNNTSSRRTQQGNQLSNPFFRSLFTPRSYDLSNLSYYDAAGNQLYYGGEDNPYWSIDNVKYKDEVNRMFGNLNMKYAFTDWLNADLKVGSDFFAFRSNGFDEIGSRGGGNTRANGTGGVDERRNTTRNLNSYLTLNASKTFGNFSIGATLGNEMVDNYSTTSRLTGVGLTVKGFNQMSNAKTYTPT